MRRGQWTVSAGIAAVPEASLHTSANLSCAVSGEFYPDSKTKSGKTSSFS